MLDKEIEEFETLLHRIALAIGIAHKHPDPAAYAASVVDASKPPAEPQAGDPVLTDPTEWPAASEPATIAPNVGDTPTE